MQWGRECGRQKNIEPNHKRERMGVVRDIGREIKDKLTQG